MLHCAPSFVTATHSEVRPIPGMRPPCLKDLFQSRPPSGVFDCSRVHHPWMIIRIKYYHVTEHLSNRDLYRPSIRIRPCDGTDRDRDAVLLSPRMILPVRLFQIFPCHMSIYLGRSDVGMAQHDSAATAGRTSLQENGWAGMAKGVGIHLFLESCLSGVLFYNLQNPGGSGLCPTCPGKASSRRSPEEHWASTSSR